MTLFRRSAHRDRLSFELWVIRLAQVLRLSAPLLYGALVITVFRPWYLAHTALADGIFFVLVGLAALSWVVTLVRVVREMIW